MYIAIEGLIGAGKTSVMMELKNSLSSKKFNFIFEPVTQFNNFMNRYKPLALAYEAAHNVPIAQAHIIDVLQKFYDEIPEQYFSKDNVLITERTLYAPALFIEARYQNVTLNAFMRDWLLIYAQTKLFPREHFRKPDVIIYLDTDLDQCLNNIHLRDRVGEWTMSKQFMQCLDTQYENFFKTLPERGIQSFKIQTHELTVKEIAQKIIEILLSIRAISTEDVQKAC